ncbi:hypothetical protein [uncultured Winogradskyella sp.]|uniref:hypothetical protein n=1 Tax=uncultured Winogradskyella sp. TaxID=395353 RepID=UPI0026065E09|nr:hypothetical protein [uncultured Winogradskyella sp.]
MKSKLTYVFTVLVALVLFACSPENTNSIPEEETKEFVFNGVTYNLVSAIITNQNTSTNDPSNISIRLFNKSSSEITGNGDLSDVTYIYFNFEAVNIENRTYNEIEDYDISINGSIIDSEFNPGTILLSDDHSESDVYAQSGSITVTNFTEFNIVFAFTFTRNDGQVISGSYDGNYLAQSIN